MCFILTHLLQVKSEMVFLLLLLTCPGLGPAGTLPFGSRMAPLRKAILAPTTPCVSGLSWVTQES